MGGKAPEFPGLHRVNGVSSCSGWNLSFHVDCSEHGNLFETSLSDCPVTQASSPQLHDTPLDLLLPSADVLKSLRHPSGWLGAFELRELNDKKCLHLDCFCSN